MELSTEQIRQWRDEASENIERIDSAHGLTPAREHINALLRPREARILTLCEEVLDCQSDAVAVLRSLPVEERMEAMGMERTPDNVAFQCYREKREADRG